MNALSFLDEFRRGRSGRVCSGESSGGLPSEDSDDLGALCARDVDLDCLTSNL